MHSVLAIKNAVLLAFLFSSLPLVAYAEKFGSNERVQDLRYGVALWHYFQEDYFPALTELMVAEQQGGILGHGKHPELMLAGLKMAYGMTEGAELRFRNLLASKEPDGSAIDDRTSRAAWYYLAEIAYIQGDLDSAEVYLAELLQVAGQDISALEVKTQSLRLNVALAQGQPQKAEQILSESSLVRSALAWFNLGNSYARNGDLGKANKSFDQALNELNNQPVITETDLALRDKIYTAGGYTALIQGRSIEAGYYFQQVQRKGLTADLALLGYGRASLEAGRYEQSLGYYRALSAAPSAVTNETVEAILAVPHVHEKMNQPGLAPAGYNQAISVYEQHQLALDALISELNEKSVPASVKIKQQSHWLDASRSQVMPPHTYLADLYAEGYFQAQLAELNDLNTLAELQHDFDFRLELLNDSIDLRDQVRKAHEVSYAELEIAQIQLRIKAQLTARRSEFEAAQASRNYLAFLDSAKTELLKRIEFSQQRINNLSAQGEEISEAQRLLKTYRGLMLWDAAQHYALNRYQAEQSIRQAEQQLDDLVIRNNQVATLLNQAPELDAYQQRVVGSVAKTQGIQAALEQQIATLEAEITAAMVAELQSRKYILNDYLNEARLARLRLYETRLYAKESAVNAIWSSAQ